MKTCIKPLITTVTILALLGVSSCKKGYGCPYELQSARYISSPANITLELNY